MANNNTKQAALKCLISFLALEDTQATTPMNVSYLNLNPRIGNAADLQKLFNYSEVAIAPDHRGKGRVFEPINASSTQVSREFTDELRYAQSVVKIDSYEKLPDNWDSFGAGPISSVAVSNAKLALKRFRELGAVPALVSPTSDNSVLFEFQDEDKRVLVEFFENGSMSAVRRHGENDELFDTASIDTLLEFVCESEPVYV
jgi:hypothetical protein